MSTPNGHMSASQRRIRDLEQQVAALQQMAQEYQAFMNYVIDRHGEDNGDGTISYLVQAGTLKILEPFRQVKTKIVRDEKSNYMEFTLLPRIILKG